ncbi:hypothetical protein GCM10010399_42280 [Dactylosporangium fulvum]|uniref:Uncharacterized protein n=1 Tax=Dactylosporangium fulvum TaxID=53359 RepID=A0ABY5VUY9_9ACTN|nr:hypothetical protein [Dactylosporangium fulvum]UWP81592.1 hypothetical protein Dfulv_41820 [Dactylosporangium fulvum]
MHRLRSIVAGGCLVAAPIFQGLSSYFWKDGFQGVNTGTLIILATVCWIVGLTAVFRSIEDRVPRYTALAHPLAMYGCVGGATFGIQGMQEELFNVSHAEAVRLLGEHPSAAFLAFWIAGVLFPTSVFVLGAVLIRIRAVPVPVGLLTCAGAVAFPLSRIPREPAVAYAADLLLLLPFAYLGIRLVVQALGARAQRSAAP